MYKALNASSKLTGVVGVGVTTVPVTAGTGTQFAVGSNHSYVTFQDATNKETCKITGQSGDNLTVVRTKALSWAIGTVIECRPCAEAMTDYEVAAQIDGSSAAAIADADEIGFVDASASNVLAKITWANVKAALKTYFDGIYRAVTGDVYLVAGASVVFEGTTDDAYETTLSAGDPTADRAIGLPNASGTLALTSDIPAATAPTPPVRQTVLSASVDTNGLPNFMSGVGTTTLAVAGSAGTPFIATAANGFSASGPVDRIGSSTANLTLAGQSTNGTYYAYVDIASNGTLTLGASSLAPTYPAGGAYSTTNGQFQFNYLGEMVGKLGSGSAAAQAYRTYIGEFTVAANVIATVTPYALMGRYVGETTFTGSTKSTVNHNLGVQPSASHSRIALRFSTAQNNYAINDEIPIAAVVGSTNLAYPLEAFDRMTSSGASVAGAPSIHDRNTLALVSLTAANVKMKFYVNRGW